MGLLVTSFSSGKWMSISDLNCPRLTDPHELQAMSLPLMVQEKYLVAWFSLRVK